MNSKTSSCPEKLARLGLPNSLTWKFTVTVCCGWLVATSLTGEEPPTKAATAKAIQVLATVGNQTITTADVERERIAIGAKLEAGAGDPAIDRRRQRELVDLLVKRALALEYLRQRGEAATDAEVTLAKSRIRQQLLDRQESWESFLSQTRLDEPALDRALMWRISWQRFLERRLTDDNLERYFTRHKADFDGTEVHVAHLVLQSANASGGSEDLESLRRRAAEVLGEIRAGKITFAEAVKRYSVSPTREMGGDLGLIGRHDPMPETFSRAAFALSPGQVSEPVETPLGVHLIQCLEIKPGNRVWTDSRAELESAVRTYLLDWAAEQVRPKVKVELKSE